MPLDPPDLRRCQAEQLEGSFMTLGPRGYRQCKKPPVFVCTENKPGKDGLVGSMSLCRECSEILFEKCGKDYATLEPIPRPLLKPPYTIRRRISDTQWEYLKERNVHRYKYGRERFMFWEMANKRLSELDQSLGWKISLCGT